MNALPFIRHPALLRHPGESRDPGPRAIRLVALGPGFRRDDGTIDDALEGSDAGFSLVEAMVALAILAIAAVGLTRTVESHIDSTRGLERRAAAAWVAENRIAELRLGLDSGAGQQVEMMGQEWRVAVSEVRTDDPEILKARVEVYGAGETTPLASIVGFVDGKQR
ncbi:MAG: type II secretion system minor pseudopilin GspI [Sphingomonas sp.]|nr:type II secretion system minor pseudopilin GspI [Sphingomonas sp.]